MTQKHYAQPAAVTKSTARVAQRLGSSRTEKPSAEEVLELLDEATLEALGVLLARKGRSGG